MLNNMTMKHWLLANAGAGGPVAEGGSFHLAAPESNSRRHHLALGLGAQGCGGVHSTLTARIVRAKGSHVVVCT